MIDNFKEPYNNNNTLENILQNKDYYKLLSKTAYKKHQDIIENDIKYTPYKYDSELSTITEKVFFQQNVLCLSFIGLETAVIYLKVICGKNIFLY